MGVYNPPEYLRIELTPTDAMRLNRETKQWVIECTAKVTFVEEEKRRRRKLREKYEWCEFEMRRKES